MKQRSTGLALFGAMVIATLFGGGWTSLMGEMLRWSMDTMVIYRTAAISALVLTLIAHSRFGAGLAVIGLAVAALIAFLCGWNPVAAVETTFQAVASLSKEGIEGLTRHASALGQIVSALFTLLSFMIVLSHGGVYLMALLSFALAMIAWRLNPEIPLQRLVPLATALVAMYAGRDERWHLQAQVLITVALFVAFAALWFVPKTPVTYPPLEMAAQKVRSLIRNLNFARTNDHQRELYGLYFDGWMPNGMILGGRVDPGETPVMQVETEHTLYLRGTVRDAYFANQWSHPQRQSMWIFNNPLARARRDLVFDTGSRLDTGRAIPIQAKVTFLRDGQSALFVPARTTAIDFDEFEAVTYFNESGEVFITRDVMAGDSYTLSAWIPSGAAPLISASAQTDAQYAAVAMQYLSVEGVENELRSLTAAIVAQAHTPSEKVYAIQQWLQSHCTYTLSPRATPWGRDFASYFVLESHEGYCTYFASAMTLMARMAGVPARYVEGYLVTPEADGETTVTTADAHAWTEVYLNGYGWMTIDATPGRGGDQLSDPSGDPGDDWGDSPWSASPPPSAPKPTPWPTVTPTATPAPGGNDPTAATPSPTQWRTAAPGDDDIEPGEAPTPPQSQTTDSLSESFRVPGYGWGLIGALAAVAWVTIRLRRTQPQRMCARTTDPSRQLMIWYRAILTALTLRGCVPDVLESPERFAQRAVAEGYATPKFSAFARWVEAHRYGMICPDADAVRLGAEAYGDVLDGLGVWGRFRWRWRRVRRGIGSVNAIP